MSKVPRKYCYAGETFAKGVSFSVLTLEMAFYPPPVHEHRCGACAFPCTPSQSDHVRRLDKRTRTPPSRSVDISEAQLWVLS